MSLYEYDVFGTRGNPQTSYLRRKDRSGPSEFTGWGYRAFRFDGSPGDTCLHSYTDEMGTASFKCEITLTLEECEGLVMQTKYTIIIIADTKRPRRLFRKIMLPCPHNSLGRHMIHLQYQHATTRRLRGYESYQILNSQKWKVLRDRMSCPWCQTTVSDARWTCLEGNEKTPLSS